MRIQQLKIDNFLSIAHAVIDFTKFREGVFAVSGPTGSGKSSIFDAIHFVLYGTPSNHNRNAVKKTLFSTFASSKDWLNVEMTFEQSGKSYRILRSMNSSGNTSVKLWCPDGSILTKITEVNDMIAEIITLNGKQFDQMVMLEQNNFSKFLLADSTERGSLLRSIFDTDVFMSVADYLKGKCTDMKREIENNQASERLYLAGRSLEQMRDEYATSEASIAGMRTRKDELTARVSNLQSWLQTRIEYETKLSNWVTAEANLCELAADRGRIDQLVKAQQLASDFGHIGPWLSECTLRQEQLQQAQLAFNVASEDLRAVTEAPVESPSKSLNTLFAVKSNLTTLLTNLRNKEKLQTEMDKLYELSQATQFIVQDAQLEDIACNLDSAKRELEIRSAYEQEVQAYEAAAENARRLIDLLPEKEKALIEAKLDVTSKAALILRNMAGSHCPVCEKPYDKEHRTSALTTCPSNAPDWSLVGKLEVEVEALHKGINDFVNMEPVPECEIQADSTAVKSTIDQLSSALVARQREVDAHNQRATALASDYERVSEMYRLALEAVQGTWETSTISGVEAELSSCELDIAKTQERHACYERYTQQLAQAQAALTHATQRLDEATKAHQEIENRYPEEQKNSYIEHKQTIESVISDLRRVHAEIASYNERYTLWSSVEKPVCTIPTEAARLKHELTGTTAELQELVERVAGYQERQTQLSTAIQTVEDLQAERSLLIKDLVDVEYVAKQLSGDNASKISLENFVLHRQLEWILQNSNKFLAQLTNNQYQLQLSWEGLGRKQGGLELGVLDLTHGTTRPSQTFSGGELFLLSLSLSIGLMVSINAVFSNVSLEMLFIDEGFGTLDSVTLNRVLALIHSLESVHSIGLISHVQDMIDSIPQGIKVEKTLTGSKLTQFR